MNKRSKLFTLIATILGSGVVFLDGVVVNIALPHIASGLQADYTGLQWVIDGYLLTLSALVVLGGSIGDVLGRKKVYLVGLAGFGLASAVCGLAPTLTLLIVARILQGVFGALLVPSSLAIIEAAFPATERALAIARWTAFTSVATAIAPFIGGYILDLTSWRWIFFINIPLVAAALGLAMYGMPSIAKSRNRHLDWAGGTAAVVALGGITYGLIEGPAHHWQPAPIIALIVGLVSAVLFARIERTSPDPMLNFKLFRSRNFFGANFMTIAMYGALSGAMFLLIIYLQTALHYSALAAGISLLPITFCLLLFSARVEAYVIKYGPRLFMTVGPILCGVGLFLLADLTAENANYFTAVFPGVLLFGIGMALTVAPLTSTVMSSVSVSHAGIASAVNNTASRVGGLLVIAILGVIAAAHTSIANAATAANASYSISMAFCAVLAVLAGVISFATIRKTV